MSYLFLSCTEKNLIKAIFPDFSNTQIQTQVDELKVLLTRLKLLDAPNNNDEEMG